MADEALLDLVVRHAEVLEAKEHLVLHDGGDHLGVDVLQHAADDARDVRERDVAGVAAVHERGTVELARIVVRDGTAHHGGERGLAGARRADDAHEVPLAHGERDSVEGLLASLVIGKRDVPELDDWVGCAHESLSCLLVAA